MIDGTKHEDENGQNRKHDRRNARGQKTLFAKIPIHGPFSIADPFFLLRRFHGAIIREYALEKTKIRTRLRLTGIVDDLIRVGNLDLPHFRRMDEDG